MTTNLLHLGVLPLKGKNNRMNVGPPPLKTNYLLEKTVKFGIHKHCDPELANQAIHGYRRSSGTSDATELDFLKCDVPYHDLVRDFHYMKALRVTERLFRPHRRLKPISFPDLRFFPWTLPVSAEVPFTTERKWTEKIRQRQADGEDIDGKLTFHNLYNEIFELNRRLIHSIKDKDGQFWTKDGVPIPYLYSSLHTRSHLVKSDEPDKLRAVFGVTKLLLMTENMFIWHLQKEYLNDKVRSPMLWGFETFRGGWNRLCARLNAHRPNTVLSTDWSGFDRFVLFEVIDDVHQMWRNWFDFDHGYEETDSTEKEGPRLSYQKTKTSSERLQNLWDWMTYSIKFTPIRAESGNLYQWQYNGLASGFQQTQLLGSFVNCIMILTTLSALGINIESNDFTILVQGDDSVTSFQEHVDLRTPSQFAEAMAIEAKRRFNAIIKPEKTTLKPSTDYVSVLSYSNLSGIAYRHPAELLARLLYPERNRGPAELASACIGICYAAMGQSRAVYNTCEDVYNFLTKQWKVEPDFREWLWMERSGQDLPYPTNIFPSFEETFIQNFSIKRRTENQNQRLWPTKPTGDYGFYFLND